MIYVCERIGCRYVIIPEGILSQLITEPIFYWEHNITIIQPYRIEQFNITNITVGCWESIYGWRHNKTQHGIRFGLLKEQILNNLPKYEASPDDLYINIRSGDIFVNMPHGLYSQPPLCYYTKIIDENWGRFKNIFILSNGKENPLVNILLEKYPFIKYIHGTILEDVSILTSAYNIVLPISSFSFSVIRFNDHLLNLWHFDIQVKNEQFGFYSRDEDLNFGKFTRYKMIPSALYKRKMKGKWRIQPKQLKLMITDKCNNKFEIIKPK